MADKVYIEPLLASSIKRILEIEKPCALLAGMGGQTALNIASELAHSGVLADLGVNSSVLIWMLLTRLRTGIYSTKYANQLICQLVKLLLVIQWKR